MTSADTYSNPPTLKDCPDSPNCVSSQAGGNQSIEPFVLQDNTAVSVQKLVHFINSMDSQVAIIHDEKKLHAEFTSAVFRFVDDLDLILDNDTKHIHVRSASRTGYYDFGVNRRRVEKLRNALKEGLIIQ